MKIELRRRSQEERDAYLVRKVAVLLRENRVLREENRALGVERSRAMNGHSVYGIQLADYGLPEEAFDFIVNEDKAQLGMWGNQRHSIFEWLTYTTEELGELAKAISEVSYRDGTLEEVKKEAVQVATLALKIAWMISEL